MINNLQAQTPSQNFGSIKHFNGGQFVRTITGKEELEKIRSFQALPSDRMKFQPAEAIKGNDKIVVRDESDRYEIEDDSLQNNISHLGMRITEEFSALKLKADGTFDNILRKLPELRDNVIKAKGVPAKTAPLNDIPPKWEALYGRKPVKTRNAMDDIIATEQVRRFFDERRGAEKHTGKGLLPADLKSEQEQILRFRDKHPELMKRRKHAAPDIELGKPEKQFDPEISKHLGEKINKPYPPFFKESERLFTPPKDSKRRNNL